MGDSRMSPEILVAKNKPANTNRKKAQISLSFKDFTQNTSIYPHIVWLHERN